MPVPVFSSDPAPVMMPEKVVSLLSRPIVQKGERVGVAEHHETAAERAVGQRADGRVDAICEEQVGAGVDPEGRVLRKRDITAADDGASEDGRYAGIVIAAGERDLAGLVGDGGRANAVGNDAGIHRSGGAAAFEQGGGRGAAVGHVLKAVEEALTAEGGRLRQGHV